MPVIKDTCTCQESFNHSYVINSRYQWNKTYQEYQKHRRRQCFECNGRFSTIEINNKEFRDLIQKAKELENIKAKAEKLQQTVQIKPDKAEIKTKEVTGQKNLSIQKINFNNLIDSL